MMVASSLLLLIALVVTLFSSALGGTKNKPHGHQGALDHYDGKLSYALFIDGCANSDVSLKCIFIYIHTHPVLIVLYYKHVLLL